MTPFPLTFATIATVASATLTRGGWQPLDVRRGAVVQLLPPFDPAAPPNLNFLELYAAPSELPEATHGAIKATGARVWLPEGGRWYLQLLSDVAARVDYLVIDAPSAAWAIAYVNRGSGNATSVRGGYEDFVEITGDTKMFNIGSNPDALSVTVWCRESAGDGIRVNIGDDTNAAERGRYVAPGEETTFELARLGPASVWACPINSSERVGAFVTH